MKVELNHKAVKALLQGKEVQELLQSLSKGMAQKAGPDYVAKVRTMPTRAIAIVEADKRKAVKDGNAALKAMK